MSDHHFYQLEDVYNDKITITSGEERYGEGSVIISFEDADADKEFDMVLSKEKAREFSKLVLRTTYGKEHAL